MPTTPNWSKWFRILKLRGVEIYQTNNTFIEGPETNFYLYQCSSCGLLTTEDFLEKHEEACK